MQVIISGYAVEDMKRDAYARGGVTNVTYDEQVNRFIIEVDDQLAEAQREADEEEEETAPE